MSDVAPASFFPTPLEIAGGLRWMRAHPVVATAAAAAAATAVSVLTFLQTRAGDREDDELLCEPAAGSLEDADGSDADEEELDALCSAFARRSRVRRRPAGVGVVVERSCEPLAPAAACHVRKLSEEICSSTDSDASSSPTRGRQSSFGDLDAEAMLPSVLSESAAEAEDSSASPQWGWYVSTTPPEDYYQD